VLERERRRRRPGRTRERLRLLLLNLLLPRLFFPGPIHTHLPYHVVFARLLARVVNHLPHLSVYHQLHAGARTRARGNVQLAHCNRKLAHCNRDRGRRQSRSVRLTI
jgi:hypothetical protein